MSFNVTVSAVTSSTLPQSVQLYLQQNGSTVSGAGASHNFRSSGENESLSFYLTVSVQTTPATLTVMVNGGPITYSDASITVNRLGNI